MLIEMWLIENFLLSSPVSKDVSLILTDFGRMVEMSEKKYFQTIFWSKSEGRGKNSIFMITNTLLVLFMTHAWRAEGEAVVYATTLIMKRCV